MPAAHHLVDVIIVQPLLELGLELGAVGRRWTPERPGTQGSAPGSRTSASALKQATIHHDLLKKACQVPAEAFLFRGLHQCAMLILPELTGSGMVMMKGCPCPECSSGLVLARLAGAQLGGVGLRVALEGAGEAVHDGAAYRLVDGLVGDEPRRRLVEAEATLEHGLVGGADILQRVQAELLEEGCAEGFHDVGEAEVHAQVAVVHLPELVPAHHLRSLRQPLDVLGFHLLELGVVLLGRLAPHLGAGHALEGHGHAAWAK